MDKRLKTVRKIVTSNFQTSGIDGVENKSLMRLLDFFKM